MSSRITPNRIVDLLKSGAGNAPTTDFIFALAAVRERASNRDDHWSPLVDAGVIDALCQCVLLAKTRPFDPISGSRLRIETSGSTASTSSYYHFLVVLDDITQKFSEPLSQTDLKVIHALRTYWSQMMIRVWDRPEQSLIPHSQFVNERRAVAKLLLGVIGVDPTFISVIDEESDLTVTVLSRYWVYATDPPDAFLNTSTLAEMMDPQSKPIINYRKQHPLPRSFFRRIMEGGTTPSDFVSTVAKHLPRIYGIEGYMEVVLFQSVWKMAIDKTCEAHTAFLSATRESSLLWSNLFALLRRSAADDQPDYTNARNGRLVFPITINFFAFVIDNAIDDLRLPPPEEHVSLIKLWVANDFWPALNETLTKGFIYVAEDDFQICRSVVAIFRHFIHALEHNEYLRPLLNPYFPQQSLLLVTFQMTKLVLTELQPDTPGNIPLELDCGRCYYTLQEVCRIPGQCDRRGCQRPSTARCSKCKTTYCTPECQRQDWKEHKPVCPLKVVLTGGLSKGSNVGSSSSMPTV